MQGSKASFFSKTKKANHDYDDGTKFRGGSHKRKDHHHVARDKGNKQDLKTHF